MMILKAMDRQELKERVMGVMVLISIIIMTLYHVFATADNRIWSVVWSINENVMCVLFCWAILTFKKDGILRELFTWPLMSYFVLRGIYYVNCYWGVHIASDTVWNSIMITPLILGIIYCTYLRWHEKREN